MWSSCSKSQTLNWHSFWKVRRVLNSCWETDSSWKRKKNWNNPDRLLYMRTDKCAHLCPLLDDDLMESAERSSWFHGVFLLLAWDGSAIMKVHTVCLLISVVDKQSGVVHSRKWKESLMLAKKEQHADACVVSRVFKMGSFIRQVLHFIWFF